MVISLFPGLLPGVATPAASAAAVSTLCYAIADDGDRLVTINRITGGNFQDVGGLGVTQVEAIEWSLNATILYAANAGVFGKINLTNGTFTQIGSGFGSGTGTETPSGDGSVVFNDIDGLAMDATTGIMYGTERNGDGTTPDDVLIQINLTTGAHVNNAFGVNKDFVSINTSSIQAGLNDVDDIAVNPVDGQMYAVANNSGGSDRLVKVNKLTGVVTDVGRLRKADNTPIDDMEGFSFYNDGTFYGTTGSAGGGNSNKLWQIDTTTGIATEIGTFASYGDYEAVGCLVAGSNTISGVVFEDVNGNGAYNSGTDINRQNVTVRLYRDADNNGSYETLVNTITSAANGTYSFEVGVTGNFQVVVDQATLPNPPTPTLSTPGSYNISFTGYGNTSTGNDFGYVTTGSIGNYIWLDLDADGVQDANEPGIPGIVVELDDGNCTPGSTCPQKTTDADGLYSFPNLNAGTYTVRVLTNMSTLGLTQTYDPDESGVCATCNGNDANIVLASGQVYALADFGYVGSGSIGDFVWDDASNNGAYDAGEAGLDGVQVELTWYGPNGVAGGGDDVKLTKTTVGGGYDFTALPSGNYSVDLITSTAPAGYVLTTANDPLAVSLSTGQDYNTADFGLYRAPEAIKQLYFTTPGQGMDRISPVNTNDTTTAASAALVVPQTTYQVRDEFNDGEVYTGNDGNQNWVGPWTEVGDDADSTSGKIKVVDNLNKLGYCVGSSDFCIEFKTDEIANNGYSIYREVNMSNAASAVSRVFSFKYYYKLDDVAAEMKVQYSCNGGGSWTTFPNGTFNQTGGEQTGTFSETIPCAASNTRVRFISTGTKKDKTFSFDDADITWVLPATPDTETFTQSAALVKPLTLPATGVITATAYLSVTTGFIDLTKPVPMTAIVRHNSPATTLATMTNPTVVPLLPPLLNDVEDTFPVKGEYTHNTGSVNWLGPWQEELDGGAPGGGDIKVDDPTECPAGSCLLIKANNPNIAIHRSANLEGAVSAILTYEYYNLLEATDSVLVEVSKNGGVSYTSVLTHTGAQNGDRDSITLDITPYASTNTTVRFRVGVKDAAKTLYIDDVRITYAVNQGFYLATWTGTIPSNTTIPSGASISTDITSAVGGTTMKVLYDSVTYPSRIEMKVSTFINVDTLGVYSAPSPGGSLITQSAPGDTVYIRATVSDPFGAADITNINLGITDIGCGSVNTTISAPIASTASTKTYEYAWSVGSCTGEYLATVSANEGTEGVTHRKAVPHTVVEPRVNVTGTVFDDANGSQVKNGAEVFTNAGGTLRVNLIDSSGNVSATTTVDANGLYTFTNVLGNRTYSLQLTTNAGVIGQPKPATALPSGWVTTGENTSGTPDGTPDSQLAAVVGTTNVTGKNFGIEQLPESDNKTAASQPNPGGTVQVTVPTLSGSDPEDGTLGSGNSFRIVTLPTNGTLYYNGTPVTAGQLIANYNPSLLTVDPIDGAVSVSFTYASVDAAGKQDPTPATVTMPFGLLSLTGTVFDDADGSQVQNGAEVGTNAGGPLYVNLINTSNNVVATATVDANGLYTFTTVAPNTTYSLQLTTNAGTIGQPKPATALPSGWVTTGENTSGTPDGTPDSQLSAVVGTTNVTGKNFGIEQLPESDNKTAASQVNPGGTVQVTVPTLSGSDPEDGTLGSGNTFKIVTLPTNGTLYYNGTPVTAGQVIANYNPSLLTVDPVDGAVTVSFTYASVDAAGKEDPTPATVTMPFSVLSLTGTVFDDANGSQVQNGAEVGTNAGGTLHVNLINTSNVVVATTAVDANGLYTFTGVGPNTTYSLQLTTNAGTIGQPKPATALPSGWVTTGENTSGTPDGTPDSQLAAVVGTTNVTGKNFGIEQLPESDNKTAARQPNPGGTTQVTVPTLSGSDPEDGTLGTGMTLKITSLPTDGTLYYNNTPVTLNQVIANYDPTKLTVDPADGAVTVSFTYATIDAAGKEDPTPATVTIPFDAPGYVVTKTLNTPSPVRKGETISFTIRITNTGNVPLVTLPLRDTYVDGVLTYIGATPPPDQANAGQLDWNDLTALGSSGYGNDLPPGSSFAVVVEFVGMMDTTAMPGGVTVNTATVENVFYDVDGPGGQAPQSVPNQPPATAPVQVIASTAVALSEASVSYADAQARLFWRTVNESDVIGFHIYRSVNGGATERITAEMIPAQKPGQSDGARYDYSDAAVAMGNRYSYAVEFIGAEGVLGREPLGEVFSGGRIFLPAIRVGTVAGRDVTTFKTEGIEEETAQNRVFLPTVGQQP